MRARGIILGIIVLLIVAAVFAWRIFNPGPMAFAGGSTVALADYHAADPTGVPAELKNADVVKRGVAPAAPASPKEGNATAEAVGKRIFEGACVHCHGWTGVSQISPFATIAGARGVNDRTATNVVQIVISGTKRHTPDGVISMPAFGSAYSDSEIAAVANYVTARFGSAPSKLTDKDVAELRSQAAD